MRILLGSRMVRSVFNIGVIVMAPLVALCVWYVLRQVVEVNHDWLAVGVAALSAALFTLVSLAKGFGRVMSTAREMELLASQQQLEYLYERSPVPYLTVNKAGEITLANLAAARLMKASVENLIGQNLLERLVIEDTEEASIFFGKVNTGITVTEMEMQLDSYDGARHWVLLSIFVYGRESERLVALVDITHQKQIDQAKSEFVALAAHQLRTPIAAIRWNAELLKLGLKDSFTEDQSKYYTKIERNVMRMINLINDFLSVSKLETGTFATAVVDIPLADFCASVIDEHDGMITEKKIRVDQQFTPVEYTLPADTRLLHIIINNLFSNAVKYTKEGGAVLLKYEVTESALTITVADTGIGVPASELEKLFTKFYRASNAQIHRTEGTGLGLYIVKQSVEMMGGTINVSSEENVGTTFVVTLPAH